MIEFLGFLLIISIIVLPKLIDLIKTRKLEKKLNNSTGTEYENALKEQQNQYDIDILDEVTENCYTPKFESKQFTLEQFINDTDDDLTRKSLTRRYILNEIEKGIEVHKELEKAKKHLRNFRIIDNIKVESDEIAEGNTINKLTENKINLDIDSFKNLCSNIFAILMTGTTEEIETINNLISNDISSKFIKQISQFQKDNLDYKREDLIIEELSLFDFEKTNENYKIKVFVKAKLKEFIAEKNTGKILRGNPNIMVKKQILLTFLMTNNNANCTLIKIENI